MTEVKIGNYWSYTDLGFLLTASEIGSPQPQTEYTEAEGIDGDIDLTESLGAVHFDEGEMSFKFRIFSNDILGDYSSALNKWHGRSLAIQFYSELSSITDSQNEALLDSEGEQIYGDSYETRKKYGRIICSDLSKKNFIGEFGVTVRVTKW